MFAEWNTNWKLSRSPPSIHPVVNLFLIIQLQSHPLFSEPHPQLKTKDWNLYENIVSYEYFRH